MITFSHADRHAGEFGDGTEIVVAELHEGGSVRIVHRLERLERDKDNRTVHLPDHGSECGTCRIGHHVNEQEIEIGGLQFREDLVGFPGVVDHSEIGHGHAVVFDFSDQHGGLARHLVEETGKLLPVCVKSDGKDSDIGGQGFSAFDFHSFTIEI